MTQYLINMLEYLLFYPIGTGVNSAIGSTIEFQSAIALNSNLLGNRHSDEVIIRREI